MSSCVGARTIVQTAALGPRDLDDEAEAEVEGGGISGFRDRGEELEDAVCRCRVEVENAAR